MGNTIEQHRSAIGRFKPSGWQRVSAKTRRERVLKEILAILSVAKIRREAKQVDIELFSQNTQHDNKVKTLFDFSFGEISSLSLLSLHSGC